jgi:hypothetical protein
MADLSTYEGRQKFRDEHPGWIVDANSVYDPASGQEHNSSGQVTRNTGAEPGRVSAGLFNRPATQDEMSFFQRMSSILESVRQLAGQNQIASGPGGAFLNRTGLGVYGGQSPYDANAQLQSGFNNGWGPQAASFLDWLRMPWNQMTNFNQYTPQQRQQRGF